MQTVPFLTIPLLLRAAQVEIKLTRSEPQSSPTALRMIMFVPVQGQGAIDGFLRKRRVEVETFLRKGGLMREAEGKDLQVLRLWFFAHDGFTEEAEALMRGKGVLWSVSDDLNGLLKHVGLRQLPELADEKIAH